MLPEFEKKLADFIKANELFDSSDKILLAVSGGADSTALLYSLSSLRRKNILKPGLHCAHINHCLRADLSDVDEAFVAEQAAELDIPTTARRVNVRKAAARKKLSIETAARQLRINTLIEIAKTNNCNVIATAHQRNDNAETILQRISRGTGYRGLGGIWPKRILNNEFVFVRPLLCLDRDQIIGYLQQRNLKWRYDHTNADCTYRRNYIRHRLLPYLQKDCSASLVERLSGLSESARRFRQLICCRADKVWPEIADRSAEKVMLDVQMLLSQPRSVIVEILRRGLAAVGCGEKNITQRHYEKMLQLARRNTSGTKICLPEEHLAHAEYGKLILSPPEKKSHPAELIDKSTRLNIPGKTIFAGYSIEAGFLKHSEKEFEKFKAKKNSLVEWFDYGKVTPPLFARFRRTGDRFLPLGLDREKKVGKFLTAARVPLQIRRELLVIADCEKIIWLCPVRASQQTKIDRGTRKVLQLKITNTPAKPKQKST
jgi:tRNA(Ile)-lysidine synthase